MLPVDFPGSNINLLKPENMTDEECEDVRAMKGVDADGYPCIIIALRPSKEDIEAIIAGRPIYVKQLSHSFHPLAVFTLNEQGEIN